jgi:Protein of unknown function (DUF4230)
MGPPRLAGVVTLTWSPVMKRSICSPLCMGLQLTTAIVFAVPTAKADWRVPTAWTLTKQAARLAEPVKVLIDVKDILEEVTRQEYKTKQEVVLKSARLTARVELVQRSFEVTVEGQEDDLFGENRFKASVSGKCSYFLDPEKLNSTSMTYDPAQKILRVKMPELQMDEPNLDRDAMKVLEQKNPWLRKESSFLKLKDKVLADQLKPKARERLQEENELIQSAAKEALGKLRRCPVNRCLVGRGSLVAFFVGGESSWRVAIRSGRSSGMPCSRSGTSPSRPSPHSAIKDT